MLFAPLHNLQQEHITKRIGNRLKELRKNAGFTSYEKFAIEHDLDRKYYWSIEKGRNISITYLKRILDIYQISFSDFFKEID